MVRSALFFGRQPFDFVCFVLSCALLTPHVLLYLLRFVARTSIIFPFRCNSQMSLVLLKEASNLLAIGWTATSAVRRWSAVLPTLAGDKGPVSMIKVLIVYSSP